MSIRCAALASVLFSHFAFLTASINASDWPMYRRDARRSAVSPDALQFPLRSVWRHKAKLPPRPAFDDPLKHPTRIDFTFIGDGSEPVLLDFDHATHPVAASGRVYFGSSADDSLRCLSLSSGKQLWAFVTGGPIRFAPQVVNGRLYAASDDGFVYCLNADSGELNWKFRAAPSSRQLVGNGRMISRWPLRSGVLVDAGVVYATAGMWPAEGVFVYAMDAETGKLKWVNDTSGTVNLPTSNPGAYAISGVAPTGYLLTAKQALVVPTGRSIPATYSLEDGRLLASVAPSYQNRRGGPAVCIDPHGSVIFGNARERLTTKSYSVHYAQQLPNMTQFGTLRADRIVIDDRAFVATNDLIRCYDANARYTKVKVDWQAACPSRSLRCLTLARNVLLMGINQSVVARDRKTGDVVWRQDQLDGFVQSIAVVDRKLLVATDTGCIYCYSDAKSEPSEAIRPGDSKQNVSDGEFERDADLSALTQNLRQRKGMALVLGAGASSYAQQVAAETEMEVVLLLNDDAEVTRLRNQLLDRATSNPGRISVQHRQQDQTLPFADFAFNLIVAPAATAAANANELHRVLRPVGGILYSHKSNDQRNANLHRLLQQLDGARPDSQTSGPASEELKGKAAAGAKSDAKSDANKSVGNKPVDGEVAQQAAPYYRRGKLPGALDWDSETTADRRVKWPLELLWFGGPGSKRTGQGAKAPIAAGGRNFVIGKNHLIALDAYNGVELWSRQLPYLYRNIGRLRNAPGPIQPWLAKSINADDEHVWLNFGHVVYKLDAANGQQLEVFGQFPEPPELSLNGELRIELDHFQLPDARGTSSKRTKAPSPAGAITLRNHRSGCIDVELDLNANSPLDDRVYWELFFDLRPHAERGNLHEDQDGVFQLLFWPASGRVENGCGKRHPNVSLASRNNGMHWTLSLSNLPSDNKWLSSDFGFAAALNHRAGPKQKSMAFGRGYLRWEFHADAFATSFNNGWARIATSGKSKERLPLRQSLSDISMLPNHALKAARIGPVGKRAGYVVSVNRERENPLSKELGGFEFNRGKGCGYPVSAAGLQVLRSGTLAFYDLDDDSGMRYFGGVRPSCTISALPAQGLVFAAEGSPGCSCNYNFKMTLAMAPARKRRHEDWAMFMAPLGPASLMHAGRFNLAAPGDRRDQQDELWLQFPRAPTLANRSMPVPVKLNGEMLRPFRINTDQRIIAGTKRPWLYGSGFEGIESVSLRLFMSDKQGAVVFPNATPVLDGVLESKAWERRYGIAAGRGGSMFISHDKQAVYIGYEVAALIDRRGKRTAWNTPGKTPHSFQFNANDIAKDEEVWEHDSLEFLVSDSALKTVLHFGVDLNGGRYDGVWSAKSKQENAALHGRWSGAVQVREESVSAEFALPWKVLASAGLDLENLVIRPRTKSTVRRQPHISHGFHPVLLKDAQPKEKLYRVSLHFAELSDALPGQRVFDVLIQNKLVLKDFDPVAVAGGANCAIVKEFSNVRADRALDIRFIKQAGKRPPMLSAFELELQEKKAPQ